MRAGPFIKGETMKISYNEACARDCSTLEKDLYLCEKAGFDFIEIRLDMLNEYLRTHTLAELKAFFDSHRIKPHALNAVYLYEEYLGPEDSPEKAQKFQETFLSALYAASRIGANAMIVVPPFEPSGKPYEGGDEQAEKNCVRILKQLGRLAADAGVRLCFEIVGLKKSAVRTIGLGKRIVEQVNLPNVGYTIDSYNLHLYQKLNDFRELRSLETEKLFAVHINNGDAVPEEEMGQDKRCFPDRGEVDLGNYLGVLREMGYSGMVSVETFRPEYWRKDPEWVIQEAYDTTRNCLQEHGCIGEGFE
jgi:2-keto-myo-inositol isomerase